MAIPNMVSVVEQMRDREPVAWRNAHTGNAQTEDFIRLLAWELHSKHDARWGLNGKRGNPNDISDDVLAWRGEGTAVDVVNGGPMEIIDCIGGAGGPNPQPQWGVGPGGPGDRGAWVKPAPVSGTQPGGGQPGGGTVTPPPPVKCGYDPTVMARLNVIDGALGAIQAQLADLAADAKAAREWAEVGAARTSDAIDQGKQANAKLAQPRQFVGRVLGQRATFTEVLPNARLNVDALPDSVADAGD